MAFKEQEDVVFTVTVDVENYATVYWRMSSLYQELSRQNPHLGEDWQDFG